MSKIFHVSILSPAMLVAVVGCDTEPAMEAVAIDEQLDDSAFLQVAIDDNAVAGLDRASSAFVLAEVELPGGGRLRFIDESRIAGEAAIGIVEVAAMGSPSYLKLYGAHDATPLEIFEAVAPDVEIPERFFDDHALRIAAAKPRLVPDLKELKAYVPPTGYHSNGVCDTSPSGFHADFVAEFTWFDDHVDFANQSGNLNFTLPLSNKRAFGVCLTAGTSGNLDATIEVEGTPGTWGYVDDLTVMPNGHYFYYWSSHATATAVYRMRITNASGDTFHLEGSW